MRLKIEARPQPSKLMGWLSPLIAVALTLLTGFVFSAFLGMNALDAFHAFFISPIEDLYGLGELGVKAAPLALIGYVLVYIFDSDSALVISGVLAVMVVAAGWIALNTTDLPKSALFPASLVSVLLGGGVTMVVVTHEMGFAREVSDRVIFMEDGKIVEVGTAEHFFTAPVEDRTRLFLSQIL